jgi:hypothetical protein
MAVVYPGLVSITSSTLTVGTINLYDSGSYPTTYDLSGQIAAHDAAEASFTFNLPSSAKPNTLMVFHDGLLLSAYDSSTQLGDYQVISASQFAILWTEGLQSQSATDTPVLLARYEASI